MKDQKPVVFFEASKMGEEASGAQSEGMIRQNCLVDVAEKICATRMIAKAHTESAVHHHDDEDTIVFAFSGQGTIVSEGGKKKQVLNPGDYALIPAYAEHQEVNESDGDVVWAIVRNGKAPKVVNLEGWGKS